MGFLSNWDGTTVIDVSHHTGDPEGTWWVEVKQCLTHEEADRILRKMMKSTIKINGGKDGGVRTSLSTDAIADQQGNLVLESILAWNLTDNNDEPLPVRPLEALERSLRMLPSPVYDEVAKVVIAANTTTSADEADFPDGGLELAEDGENVPSNDREVVV